MTLTGFPRAMSLIHESVTPLIVYWRPVLTGNAVNRVLAVPSWHRRPTGGIRIWEFGRDTLAATVKREIAAARRRYDGHVERKKLVLSQ